MKIAYILINANRREGTSRAVVEVAERLGTRHDVTIFSRTAESLDQTKVTWRRVMAPQWPDVAEFECFRLNATRMLRRERFDLIHSAGCNVWGADVYAIQTVHPKKMEVNKSESRNENVGRLRRTSRALYDRQVLRSEQRAYQVVNARGLVGYLPVSRGTEQELRESYPVDGAPVGIVPNGADVHAFRPELRGQHRTSIRREIGCSDQEIVLLFVGGEWNRKGLRLAIEAMSMAKHKNSVLVVAGDDPQRDRYRDLAQQLGVADRIRWVGFRKDITRIYAAADIFVFPSAYEAFSLATIEAAATGLPVIMCDICGAHELLGDGSGGRIVQRQPQAIAVAIDELASNAELRQRLGKEARAKVEKLFNWDRIAERTEAFYEHLLLAKRSDRHSKH